MFIKNIVLLCLITAFSYGSSGNSLQSGTVQSNATTPHLQPLLSSESQPPVPHIITIIPERAERQAQIERNAKYTCCLCLFFALAVGAKALTNALL